jgi:hypothetical protein
VKAPVEPPKQIGANPFQKSANGEIVSTRKVEESKVQAPAAKVQEPVKQHAAAEEKKVVGEAPPKKLIVSDVFNTAPK